MSDQIAEALASGAAALGTLKRVASRARKLVEDGRVTRPALSTREAAAFIADDRAGRMKVRIRLADDRLVARCPCGRSNGTPCAHAAALAMLVAGEALPRAREPAQEDSLAMRQIRRREERGRSGLFAVTPEERDGQVFGGYRVSSPSEREYRVRRQRASKTAQTTAAVMRMFRYELARSDHRDIPALGSDLLVLDEAQRIKNWRAKTADAIKRIRTRYAFVLTGTPLENRLDDLYSLMQVVDPHVLGPLWCFNRDFMALDERANRSAIATSPNCVPGSDRTFCAGARRRFSINFPR